MFVYRYKISNQTTISSSPIVTSSIYLENLWSFWRYSSHEMSSRYLLRLYNYNGESLYKTIYCMRTSSLYILSQSRNVGAGESVGFK